MKLISIQFVWNVFLLRIIVNRRYLQVVYLFRIEDYIYVLYFTKPNRYEAVLTLGHCRIYIFTCTSSSGECVYNILPSYLIYVS